MRQSNQLIVNMDEKGFNEIDYDSSEANNEFKLHLVDLQIYTK